MSVSWRCAAGLFLGGINLVVVPLMLIPLTKMLSDRVGMLTFAAVAALSTVFLFAYRVSRTAEVVLYVIGSLILLFSASIIKAFAWGLVAKLPPPPFRQVVMSYNSAIYMFGRGTGAILGPAFHNERSAPLRRVSQARAPSSAQRSWPSCAHVACAATPPNGIASHMCPRVCNARDAQLVCGVHHLPQSGGVHCYSPRVQAAHRPWQSVSLGCSPWRSHELVALTLCAP